MSQAALKLATWTDLLAFNDDAKREVHNGIIVTRPSALPRHGLILSAVDNRVGGPFSILPGGPGGWWILVDIDIQFAPHEVVRPDLTGWRRDRMPEIPEDLPILLTPDWVCEILSPSNGFRDRLFKAELYLRSGVPFYWIIDPDDRILEAWEAREGRWTRAGAWSDGDVARIPPFDAIELDVGGLFPPKRGV